MIPDSALTATLLPCMTTRSSHTAACVFYLIARIESFGPDSWVGRAWYRLENTSVAVK